MKITKIAAPVAAISLSLGMVACSEDDAQDAVDGAGQAVESATDTAGDAASDATDAASDAMNGDSDNGETVSVDAADGTSYEIPASIVDAAEADPEFGELQNVIEGGEGQVAAEYADGKYLVVNDGNDPVLVHGMIAQTWVDGGAFDNEVGAPTAEEATAPEHNGWIQEFENGTISWTIDEAGEWGPTVEQA